MESTWIAFFALLGVACTVAGPLLLSYLNAKQARQAKQEDWARQDAVAEKVAAAAKAAVEAAQRATDQASEAARLLVVENSLTAERVAVVSEKLDVIHTTLINGNTTRAQTQAAAPDEERS